MNIYVRRIRIASMGLWATYFVDKRGNRVGLGSGISLN